MPATEVQPGRSCKAAHPLLAPAGLYPRRSMDLEGYELCRCGCGRHELRHVLHLTGGLAWECFREGSLSGLRTVEVAHRGAVIKIPRSTKPPRKRKPGQSRGNPSTIRANQAAKQAAARRLAHQFPEIYAVILDDERHKRGLAPLPRRTEQGGHVTAVETHLGAVVYAQPVPNGGS